MNNIIGSQNIDVKFEHIKTFTLLHGELPAHFIGEFNNYLDVNGKIDLNDDIPKGLMNLLKGTGRSFVSLYAEQLPLSMEGNSFENVPVECVGMGVVEKSEKMYTHPIDYDTDFTTKSISFTSILNLSVPKQINSDVKNNQGYLYFNWGTNTQADQISLRPKQEKFIQPVVGRFVTFPSWLKHTTIPFDGEGTLKMLVANFKIKFTV